MLQADLGPRRTRADMIGASVGQFNGLLLDVWSRVVAHNSLKIRRNGALA